MGRFEADLRQSLAESNDEYRRLAAEHASCESRLHELQGKAILNDTERLESVDIKKQKLQLKDRMEAILRQHLEREAGARLPH
jgi:hypothetical protein